MLRLYRMIQPLTTRLYVRGLPRILWLARPLLRERGSEYLITNGTRMIIDNEDYFSWMMVWNYYDPATAGVLRWILRPGDTYVDVGANIGYFALHAARLVGPRGRVLAVEPDPRSFARLSSNIALNEASNITPVNLAASWENGTAELRLASQLGWTTLVPNSPAMQEVETVPILTARIDSVIGSQSVRLLKVDVEGWEHEVLKGSTRLLERGKTFVLFEMLPDVLRQRHQPPNAVIDLLRDFGYQFFAIRRARGFVSSTSPQLRRITPEDRQTHSGDILAVPSCHTGISDVPLSPL